MRLGANRLGFGRRVQVAPSSVAFSAALKAEEGAKVNNEGGRNYDVTPTNSLRIHTHLAYRALFALLFPSEI